MYTDHVISAEEHAAWFRRAIEDTSRKYWIIVCDGEDVGLVNLYNIDQTHRRCYWAFYVVSDNVRGKGVGSFAEFQVLNYVFDTLGLQKLCCEVLGFNKGVVEMHRRFGFVQEGLFRKHIMKRGSQQDVVCLAILKEEWNAQRPQMEERLRNKGIL
jgi:UDP-4-amino-4,6-dideoxy-N-acetyl-beta-L-altrosamine N-acetyltransferase